MHVAGIPVPEEPQRARQIGEASSSSAISDSEDSSSSGEDSDNHDVAPEPEPTPVEPDALPCAEVPMDEESHPPVLPDEVPVQEHALPVGESRVHADDGGGASSGAADSSDYGATLTPSTREGPPKFIDQFFLLVIHL